MLFFQLLFHTAIGMVQIVLVSSFAFCNDALFTLNCLHLLCINFSGDATRHFLKHCVDDCVSLFSMLQLTHWSSCL